jgi:pilus assembly protein CpaB
LTTAQKEEAGDGVNAAFAGDSLPQLAGSVAPAAVVATPPRIAAPRHVGGGGRSVEVIRGGHSDLVSY